jgi:hypothetical protein
LESRPAGADTPLDVDVECRVERRRRKKRKRWAPLYLKKRWRVEEKGGEKKKENKSSYHVWKHPVLRN